MSGYYLAEAKTKIKTRHWGGRRGGEGEEMRKGMELSEQKNYEREEVRRGSKEEARKRVDGEKGERRRMERKIG